jgi:hypothetical protein
LVRFVVRSQILPAPESTRACRRLPCRSPSARVVGHRGCGRLTEEMLDDVFSGGSPHCGLPKLWRMQPITRIVAIDERENG